MENNPPDNPESPVPTGDEAPTQASQSSQTYHPAQYQGYYDQQARFPASSAPYPPSSYPPYYAMRPPKDRSIALILEILPGLFGFLGFGWIYGGNTATGIAFLIGFLLWDVMAIVITVLTGGFGCICTVPISLVCIAVSASMLNSYTKRNPQLFGP